MKVINFLIFGGFLEFFELFLNFSGFILNLFKFINIKNSVLIHSDLVYDVATFVRTMCRTCTHVISAHNYWLSSLLSVYANCYYRVYICK